MITRIEIDGFKTFDKFGLNIQPFSAIVGPNASGKSNLFDALKFLSRLAQSDVHSAMRELRGQPEELFRQTEAGAATEMRFVIEVLLSERGVDQFQKPYAVESQRLRYELRLSKRFDAQGQPSGIFVTYESCRPIAKEDDKKTPWLKGWRIKYSRRKTAFIETETTDNGMPLALLIRQDGPQKHGNPRKLPAGEASSTALSTITTAEFVHAYALRDLLASIQFLEINPQAARRPTDRLESKVLRPDASNLASVLARLRDETRTPDRPNGVIADISADLASLIPSVQSVEVFDDARAKEYSFGVATADQPTFSSRVISDGTLRLLALLTLLDDPKRKGVLCFEEPENGVHEGRIGRLVEFLREAAGQPSAAETSDNFQILVNTHSPAVMANLQQDEIVVAQLVRAVEPETNLRTLKTSMRSDVTDDQLPLEDTLLTRAMIRNLLERPSDAA